MTDPKPRSDVRSLLESGFPVPDQHGMVAVSEHAVKALLRDRGVATPAGLTAADLAELPELASPLRPPLVLKAFGPGLVHKSDVGAVRLGLAPTTVADAAQEMRSDLAGAGITPAGYLLEEQHPGGIELIVGVVRDPAFGPVVMLGLGGTATEVLDLAGFRMAPLARDEAESLVAIFPGAALLDGARGAAPVDRTSLVDLLMALAGPDGLAERLGGHLQEIECNPVVVTESGTTALDARLILSTAPATTAERGTPTDFTPLFSPRSIAVVGASTRGTGFGNRFLTAYQDAGWAEGLTAVHPRATEVAGVPARPTVTDGEEELDYLVVAVPAEAAVDVVRQAAGKVRFVHVISGGFREMGEAGMALETELSDAVAGTGTRVLGPNCIGTYSPKGRQAFTLGAPKESGRIAVVSQSGGLSGDLVTVGTQRGLRYSKLVSIGNAVDVTAPELVDWLVDDPETDVIGLYLEGAADGARLLAALRRARGRKPVVALMGGLSTQGAAAVSSHTGSMAAPERVWAAVQEATRLTRVNSLDDLIATLGYLEHSVARPGTGSGTLVIGLGGGASVLATDACDRAGLKLDPLGSAARDRLREMGHGAGTSVANPVEIPIGPASPVDLLGATLAAVLGLQRFADVLVHVNIAAYYSYGTDGLAPLVDSLSELTSRDLSARIAVVTRNVDIARPEDVDRLGSFATEAGVPLFRTFDEAATAIAAAQRFERAREADA